VSRHLLLGPFNSSQTWKVLFIMYIIGKLSCF